MGLILKIRKKLCRNATKKRKSTMRRKVEVSNLEKASKVLIVCDVSNSTLMEASKKLKNLLDKNDVKYVSMLYTKSKEQLSMVTGDTSNILCTKTDFSWNFHPKTDDIKRLCNEDFDILFNLMHQEDMYISTFIENSMAKFKIGDSNFNNSIYDIMFDIKQGNEIFLFEQIQHYINKL